MVVALASGVPAEVEAQQQTASGEATTASSPLPPPPPPPSLPSLLERNAIYPGTADVTAVTTYSVFASADNTTGKGASQ